MKALIFLLLLSGNSIHVEAQAMKNRKLHTGSLDMVGVDQFGRTFHAIGGYKDKKQVGIFYWPWIGHPSASGIYDATKIAAMPNGLKLLFDFKSLDTAISPTGQAHFWGEPLWGYYNSGDEWVIRRQMKMLTTAGIDFIVFDLTNRVTYKSVYEKVLRIIEEFQQQGWNAPKVVFYTHSKSIETTQVLFRDLYKPNLYPNAWYRVNGKPMIIAYTTVADDIAEAKTRNDTTYTPVMYSKEILDFFYFKRPQWPADPTYPDGFPWIEWTFPQPLHGGIMSVSVASHPQVPMSRSVTSGWVNYGRGYDPAKKENIAADVDKGTFFQKQWDHAIKVDPDTVFIGGWNEWIAYKQPYGNEYMLCDAVNKEYSRDIEPMKGGYEDAFYLQMINNIRRYKGVPATSPVAPKKAIDIKGNPSQWDAVKSSYQNIEAFAYPRNSVGASKKISYQRPAPVNNLQEIKVTHDAAYIYLYIRAEKEFLQPAPGAGGIAIYIGRNKPALIGWKGYEYLVKQTPGAKGFSINTLDEHYNQALVGNADFIKNKNVIQVKIPRKQLNAFNANSIYFKVTDGVEQPEDIMDTYLSGSAMPMGRLSYQYLLQ